MTTHTNHNRQHDQDRLTNGGHEDRGNLSDTEQDLSPTEPRQHTLRLDEPLKTAADTQEAVSHVAGREQDFVYKL
jgi:hypothetical protein